jgi:hypothetical protein
VFALDELWKLEPVIGAEHSTKLAISRIGHNSAALTLKAG